MAEETENGGITEAGSGGLVLSGTVKSVDSTERPDIGDYDIYRDGTKRLFVSVVNMRFKKGCNKTDRGYAFLDKTNNCFRNDFQFDACPGLKDVCPEVDDAFNKYDTKNGCVINANKETFRKVLNKTAEQLKDKSVSCLAVIISSHGEEKDGQHCIVCADGQTFNTQEMINILNDANTDIPKIFVIQACRSVSDAEKEEKEDRGVSFSLVEKNSDDEGTFDSTSSEQATGSNEHQGFQKSRSVVTPCAPNCVVIFASTSEHEAYIAEQNGSYLLDKLTAEAEQQKANDSLFAILTRLNSSMAKEKIPRKDEKDERKKYHVKSTCNFSHELIKNLTLKKKDEKELQARVE